LSLDSCAIPVVCCGESWHASGCPARLNRPTEKDRHPIARTAYYNGIAKQWHRVTGYHGGAFKRYVLNDLLFDRIGHIEGRAILELGAGNGYFAPLMRRRYSGQTPARLVISDQAQALVDIARTTFGIENAEYLTLDVQDALPFADDSFDLILATMVFNELPLSALRHAARECHRILAPGGRLLATVAHPALVYGLAKQGALTDFGRGLFAMPSAEGLRLPVARRSVEAYQTALTECGFTVTLANVLPDEKTLHAKPGFKLARETPMALLCDCRRSCKSVVGHRAPVAGGEL
jgi:SAM-dependent methyltransferase